MSHNVATQIGSGTITYTRGILPASQRGIQSNGEGVRFGSQVVLANPEDINSVDAFAVSGVSIGTIPVRIWGPGINPLPRQRDVYIHNDGPGDVYFGPTSTSVIAPSGMHLHTGAGDGALQAAKLPFLSNVDIWARATGAGASIRILAY